MQVCRKDRVLNVRIQCRGRTLTVKMPQGPDCKTASRFINEHLFLGECCEALSRTVSGQYPPGQNPLVPISPSSKICYVQVNLDMTDSMGPGKLVRHMQNPSYTYDEYLICIGLGPSISSVICKNPSYSGPSYPSSPVLII